MRTVFKFNEGIDKRKVTLIHSKKIKIFKEIRDDHIIWFDHNNNLIKYREYIIIQYTKNKKINLDHIKLDYSRRMSTGYLVTEYDDYMEIAIYDQITFTWLFYDLEKTKLFKIIQRVIPDFKLHGELFSMYINPKGFYQCLYDIFFSLIEAPFVSYKSKEMDQKLKSRNIENKL
jgi:hypothetical protein